MNKILRGIFSSILIAVFTVMALTGCKDTKNTSSGAASSKAQTSSSAQSSQSSSASEVSSNSTSSVSSESVSGKLNADTKTATEIIELINKKRRADNRAELTANDGLYNVAKLLAEETYAAGKEYRMTADFVKRPDGRAMTTIFADADFTKNYGGYTCDVYFSGYAKQPGSSREWFDYMSQNERFIKKISTASYNSIGLYYGSYNENGQYYQTVTLVLLNIR